MCSKFVLVAVVRSGAVGLGFSDVEVAPVRLLVVDADDELDHPRVRELAGVKVSRYEVDALDHHRDALERRARDQRLDAGVDDSRLLAESDDHGIGALRHRNSQTSPRRERALVDRRHEVLGEYSTHDLTDGIRRGNAGDAEPVRDLGGDRRLADTGRSADRARRAGGRACESSRSLQVALARSARPPCASERSAAIARSRAEVMAVSSRSRRSSWIALRHRVCPARRQAGTHEATARAGPWRTAARAPCR